MISLLSVTLPDQLLERVRRNFYDAIRELQRSAILRDNVITVTLPDGADTKVAHKLGRAPTAVFFSAVRGAVAYGRIDDVRRDDRAKQLTLCATGFGTDIELEVLVV